MKRFEQKALDAINTINRTYREVERQKRQVYIDWDSFGYTVVVEENGEEIYRYDAGNSPLESTIVVGTHKSVSLSQLRSWAKQTGREIAEEYDAHYNGKKQDLR